MFPVRESSLRRAEMSVWNKSELGRHGRRHTLDTRVAPGCRPLAGPCPPQIRPLSATDLN